MKIKRSYTPIYPSLYPTHPHVQLKPKCLLSQNHCLLLRLVNFVFLGASHCLIFLLASFSFFFFCGAGHGGVLRLELKALHLLAKCSTAGPFCCSYFSYIILLLCPGQPGLQLSYLHFLCSWGNRCTPPCLAFFWLRWDLAFCLSWP
jgi:hypothetical protein